MRSDGSIPTIALVGNPNCGKTTVFNGLTGSDQRVGNWPGVTVELAEGFYGSAAGRVRVMDLPGVYGLTALAEDERISRDYLLSRQADLIVNIIDASTLERSLYLSGQLIELGLPFIAALTMADLAGERGIRLDLGHLSRHLGVPVVPVVAIRPGDIAGLRLAVAAALDAPPVSATHLEFQDEIEKIVGAWSARLAGPARRLQVNPRWLGIKLLENDAAVGEAVRKQGLLFEDEIESAAAEVRSLLKAGPDEVIAAGRYGFAHGIARDVIRRTPTGRSLTDSLDRVFMHRFLGIPIFFAAMFLVFELTITVGGALIEPFEFAAGAVFVQGVGSLLSAVGAPAWAVAMLARGVGAGLQTVAAFIPVIFIMFAALSVLEDSGYMARAAFLMDRLMRIIGLPGRAFVPLLVGFGCSVPAVLGTRSLESRRDRRLTIFMVPFMSCGARLPVYAFFAAIFFPSTGGLVVFSLYLIGILLAAGTGLLLGRTLFRGESSHFVMELPPYHAPRMRHILIHSWDRLRYFLLRAGKVIVLFVSIFGLLNSLGPDGSLGNDDTDRSILAALGKAATPVFAPLGIEKENWPAAVALFAGVFAKEAVIGTLNSLYSQNRSGPETDLGTIVRSYFPNGPAQAYAFLLFVLIYFPCVSTLAASIKEMGLGLSLLLAAYTTGLAWISATLFYQLTVAHDPAWIAATAGMAALLFTALWLAGRRPADRSDL